MISAFEGHGNTYESVCGYYRAAHSNRTVTVICTTLFCLNKPGLFNSLKGEDDSFKILYLSTAQTVTVLA
jgi:hypothetical protein